MLLFFLLSKNYSLIFEDKIPSIGDQYSRKHNSFVDWSLQPECDENVNSNELFSLNRSASAGYRFDNRSTMFKCDQTRDCNEPGPHSNAHNKILEKAT